MERQYVEQVKLHGFNFCGGKHMQDGNVHFATIKLNSGKYEQKGQVFFTTFNLQHRSFGRIIDYVQGIRKGKLLRSLMVWIMLVGAFAISPVLTKACAEDCKIYTTIQRRETSNEEQTVKEFKFFNSTGKFLNITGFPYSDLQNAANISVEETILPPEKTSSIDDIDVRLAGWNYQYTEEDVKMLGDLMYAEEGILLSRQSYEDARRAHILAGSVVLNRLADGRWGDTLKEVIFEGNGYAKSTRKKIGNIETPDEVYEWAEDLLKNGPRGPKELVFQAQFKQGVKVYAHIDNQYFCLMKAE